MNIIPLIIVIIYLIALFGASAVSARIMKKRATSGQGFLNANKGLSIPLVAAMIAGMAIGGSATVGVAQTAMGSGMSAGMYTFAWAFAAATLGLLVSTRARKLDMVTLPDLFNKCFGGTAKILMTIGQLVIMLAIISLQYVAGGAILSAMLPQYFTYTSGMILTAICFVGITVIGGMLGAGYSNIINMIVIYLGLIFGVIAVLTNMGGTGALSSALVEVDPDVPWFSLISGVGFTTILGWVITMFTSVNATQQNVQIALSGKTDKAARPVAGRAVHAARRLSGRRFRPGRCGQIPRDRLRLCPSHCGYVLESGHCRTFAFRPVGRGYFYRRRPPSGCIQYHYPRHYQASQ